MEVLHIRLSKDVQIICRANYVFCTLDAKRESQLFPAPDLTLIFRKDETVRFPAKLKYGLYGTDLPKPGELKKKGRVTIR